MSPTKKSLAVLVGAFSAIIIAVIGVLFTYYTVFSERIAPGTYLGKMNLTGFNYHDATFIIDEYDADLENFKLEFEYLSQKKSRTLSDLGVTLDKSKTFQELYAQASGKIPKLRRQVNPSINVEKSRIAKVLAADFEHSIEPPQNASLKLNAVGKFDLISSNKGEVIDANHIEAEIIKKIDLEDPTSIALSVNTKNPMVENYEVERAKTFAEQLANEGAEIVFEDQIFQLKPFTAKRMITFVEQVDPNNLDNHILGVKFDHASFAEYLSTTIAPIVNQTASNARFTVNGVNQSIESNTNVAGINTAELDTSKIRVEKFSLPKQGREINIARTASHAASKLAQLDAKIPLAVDVTNPEFSDLGDIERLGVTTLLARGESDFKGSPNNRAHNISVGASRYHGLLIPPGDEFSFNEFLGPVDAARGFKPELVIKSNVTIPEYGGGLCQVSTSMFRTALNAGLEITKRRNHSYAVSYYGKPGLDATIYPPYTDLRFRNNTPSYILVQTKLDGTRLAFEMWGTDDGREVVMDGPNTYNRQPNGAVSAVVSRTVTNGGQTLIDEKFYSRYKSPALFPKILKANGET